MRARRPLVALALLAGLAVNGFGVSHYWVFNNPYGNVFTTTPLAAHVGTNPVIFVAGATNLCAVNDWAGTAELRWSYTVSPEYAFRNGHHNNNIVFHGGQVFFVNAKNLLALDADTGAKSWQKSLSSGNWHYLSADAGHDAVLATDGSYLRSFNSADGNTNWNSAALAKSYLLNVSAVTGDTVYLGSDNGNVYALDTDDGSVKWSYAASRQVKSTPVRLGDLVYFGANDGKVYCLRDNGDSAELVWSYQTDSYVRSSPAVANGHVYVGSFDRHMYALNALTGELAWKFRVGREIDSQAMVDDSGRVYFLANDGIMYCLDGATGRFLWRYQHNSLVNPYTCKGIAIYGNRVYLSSDNLKTLNALNLSYPVNDTSPPVISNLTSYISMPVAAGADLPVFCMVYDTGSPDVGVKEVKLEIFGGPSGVSTTACERYNIQNQQYGLWLGCVPGNEITTSGFAYRILAWDAATNNYGAGNLATSEIYSVSAETKPVTGPGWYAGDPHVHDEERSLNPALLYKNVYCTVKDSKAQGCKWIITTPHWSNIDRELSEYATDPEFVWIPGDEIALFESAHSYAHHNALNGRHTHNWDAPDMDWLLQHNDDGGISYFHEDNFSFSIPADMLAAGFATSIPFFQEYFSPALYNSYKKLFICRGSDNRGSGRAYTYVYAQSLNRTNILNALRQGHTYAVANHFYRYRLDFRVNGQLPGETLTVAPGEIVDISLSFLATNYPAQCTNIYLRRSDGSSNQWPYACGESFSQNVSQAITAPGWYSMTVNGADGAYENASALTTPIWVDVVMPSAPTNVAASDGAYTDKVRVTWNPVIYADGYSILRSASDDTNSAEQVGSTTNTVFDDATAPVGEDFYYWVIMTNICGPSPFSAGDAGYANAVAADSQAVVVEENTPKAIPLAAADAHGDHLAYSILDGPAHGALAGEPPGITYTPAEDYTGPDVFTFKAAAGPLESNTGVVSITVSAPVAITSHPQSRTNSPGSSASFGVTATGTAPQYQWQRNAANIPAATGSVHAINPVEAGHAGSYRCIVSNAANSVTSEEAILVVTGPAAIISDPQPQTCRPGTTARFAVEASGTPPLFYQWQKDASDIASANGAAYEIAAVATDDAGYYRCLASNALNVVTSAQALLTINITPLIETATPTNVMAATAFLGGNVTETYGRPVTERGVCWGTNSGEAPAGPRYSESGSFGAGGFSFLVTNLPAGRTNYFIAFAANEQGTNFTAATPFLTRPDAPSTLPATGGAMNVFHANWTAPAGATNYWLDAAPTNDFAECLPGYSNRWAGARLSCAVTGLQGTAAQYYFRVRAGNAAGASTNSDTRTVPAGAIGLAPAVLEFAGQYCGPNPAPQSAAVTNMGGLGFHFTNAISYSAGAEGWLTVAPATGSVYAGSAAAIACSVNLAGLHSGTYCATNTVISSEATNSPQSHAVALTVGKAQQVISFPAIRDQLVTSTVPLRATANSGWDISFSVESGPGVIRSGVLGFTATGAVYVVARQEDSDADWDPAQPVTNRVMAVAGLIGSYAPGPSAWTNMGSGLGNSVFAIAVLPNGDLYAGGSFTNAGGTAVNRVAKWNGASWSALDIGVGNMGVRSLALDSNNCLFAGGYFTNAGPAAVNNIAMWDGAAWTNLGDGLTPVGMGRFAYALVFGTNGDLCAGGSFTDAGGAPASRVARWDGASWSALGDGLGNITRALALGPAGELYAGGLFTNAGAAAANRVAEWDGSSWSALGDGFSNNVYALAFGPAGELYAGGAFTNSGAMAADYLARWDGAAWSEPGGGLGGTVYALAAGAGGSLYAGGQFTTAGDAPANYVARWDGISWTNLGSGISDGASRVLYSLAFGPDGELYAGGTFTAAGGVPATNIAKWAPSYWIEDSGVSPDSGPTNGGTRVVITGTSLSDGSGGDVTAVSICGALATNIESQSSTQVVVWTGGGPAGTGDVRVYSTSRGEVARVNAFTYYLPQAIAILGVNGAQISSGERADAAKGSDFGPVAWGAATTNAFTVTNRGDRTLAISGMTTSGASAAYFTVQSFPGSVPATGSFSLVISYNPPSAGAHTAALQIANNTPDNNPFTLFLAGTGAKHDQTITAFPNPGDQARTNTVVLRAEASSGLPVSNFTVVSGPGVIASLSNLSFTGAGAVSVKADQAGNDQWHAAPAKTNAFTVHQVAPPAPSGVAASDGVYADKVRVTWNASEWAAGYEVYRHTINNPSSADQIAATSATACDDTGAAADATYYYWVKATNSAGSSAFSAAATGRRAPPAPALPAPTGLSASDGVYTDKVAVSWNAVSGASGYNVWRARDNNSASAVSLANTVAPGYDDTSAPARSSTMLYYWVKAFNSVTTSAFSSADWGFCKLRPDAEIISGQPAVGDYDGDGRADPAVYDLARGRLFAWLSAASYLPVTPVVTFRMEAGDLPAAGDFDGDGLADPGVFNPESGSWHVWLSSANYQRAGPVLMGLNASDIPVPADFDGDGLTDPAVYHANAGEWRVWLSSAQYAAQGPFTFRKSSADVPVPGRYDAGRLADPAIYQRGGGAWHLWLSGAGYASLGPFTFITAEDHIPTPADYDGDGLCDPATYMPSAGKWRIWASSINYGPVELELK